MDAIERKTDVCGNGHAVFAAVDKMWKDVARVLVTPDTLQGAPYSWQRCHEAEEAGVARVALVGIIPFIGV